VPNFTHLSQNGENAREVAIASTVAESREYQNFCMLTKTTALISVSFHCEDSLWTLAFWNDSKYSERTIKNANFRWIYRRSFIKRRRCPSVCPFVRLSPETLRPRSGSWGRHPRCPVCFLPREIYASGGGLLMASTRHFVLWTPMGHPQSEASIAANDDWTTSWLLWKCNKKELAADYKVTRSGYSQTGRPMHMKTAINLMMVI